MVALPAGTLEQLRAPDSYIGAEWFDHLLDRARRYLRRYCFEQNPRRLAPLRRVRCRDSINTDDLIFEAEFRDHQRWNWLCARPPGFDLCLLECSGFDRICEAMVDQWIYQLNGFASRDFRIDELIFNAHRRIEDAARHYARAAAYMRHNPPAMFGIDPGLSGDDRTTVTYRDNELWIDETRQLTAEQVRYVQTTLAERVQLETERLMFREMLAGYRFEGLAEAARARPEADARGQKLLREWLSPAQRKQYEESGGFEVTGRETGTRYRIEPGASYNVKQLDRKGRAIASLCFAPEGSLVIGDIMLAQKVALETNERAALKVANRSPGLRGADLIYGGGRRVGRTYAQATWI